jgi:hypothetical protein
LPITLKCRKRQGEFKASVNKVVVQNVVSEDGFVVQKKKKKKSKKKPAKVDENSEVKEQKEVKALVDADVKPPEVCVVEPRRERVSEMML